MSTKYSAEQRIRTIIIFSTLLTYRRQQCSALLVLDICKPSPRDSLTPCSYCSDLSWTRREMTVIYLLDKQKHNILILLLTGITAVGVGVLIGYLATTGQTQTDSSILR